MFLDKIDVGHIYRKLSGESLFNALHFGWIFMYLFNVFALGQSHWDPNLGHVFTTGRAFRSRPPSIAKGQVQQK
jgi:hypothetical protein